jgi:hypothetical protein
MMFVTGCGEVANKPDNPDSSVSDDAPAGDFTLSVDPAALTVPIASSATVTVTIARTGSIGDVLLSATGLGPNLAAEFSPNPIPQGATTSTATIHAKGGTAPTTTSITLTGESGSKTHSATVDVTTQTITVTGTIRGNRPGVKVGIIGKQSVTSGAGGVFTFADVTPPYDLYTFVESGCGSTLTPTVYYFDDLTRPDPVVSAAPAATPICVYFVVCGIFPACPSSSVSGTKSGAGNNTDPVVFGWTGGSFSGTLAGNGSYSGTARWGSDSGNTSTGRVHAIQLTRKANGAPDTFLGHARTAQVTLTSGSSTANVALPFATVSSTATITGSVSAPPGYPDPTITLNQEFEGSYATLWESTTTAIDAAFPLLASAGGNSLYARAALDGGFTEFVQPLTATATVDFILPAAAVLAQPADSATGVTTSTPFSWTAPVGVVSELNASASSAQGTARGSFRIFTTATQVNLPVIPELPLPSGQSYVWRVYGYGPSSSINDAAAANELEQVSATDYSGPAHAYTTSALRSFTTQ